MDNQSYPLPWLQVQADVVFVASSFLLISDEVSAVALLPANVVIFVLRALVHRARFKVHVRVIDDNFAEDRR